MRRRQEIPCNPYKFNLQNIEEHKELDGKVVPLSEKFRVLKELGDFGIDGLGEACQIIDSWKGKGLLNEEESKGFEKTMGSIEALKKEICS